MKFKIKNWPLACLALLLFCILMSLGFWQLARAKQKKLLLASFSARSLNPPLHAPDIVSNHDLRFYRVSLEGTFDNSHSFLLDNKIFHGQVGYEIYTPLRLNDSTLHILVDRGFIPEGTDRRILPLIQGSSNLVKVNGMLNLPPSYFSWGQMVDTHSLTWPLRVEFIQLATLEKILHYPLLPYVLNINPNHPAAYPIEWQVVSMGPERHLAYAVQWFALALTLLILFVILNRDSK